MNKQDFFKYVKDSGLVSVSSKFTGQITLVLNLNQGGVTDIEKSVFERIK